MGDLIGAKTCQAGDEDGRILVVRKPHVSEHNETNSSRTRSFINKCRGVIPNTPACSLANKAAKATQVALSQLSSNSFFPLAGPNKAVARMLGKATCNGRIGHAHSSALVWREQGGLTLAPVQPTTESGTCMQHSVDCYRMLSAYCSSWSQLHHQQRVRSVQ